MSETLIFQFPVDDEMKGSGDESTEGEAGEDKSSKKKKKKRKSKQIEVFRNSS